MLRQSMDFHQTYGHAGVAKFWRPMVAAAKGERGTKGAGKTACESPPLSKYDEATLSLR
jgi:hypothetical protein